MKRKRASSSAASKAPARIEDQDLLDRLEADWRVERPDLDASAMGVVGRVIHLAGLLRNRANKALAEFDLHYTDLDVIATLRRSGKPYLLTPTELTRSVLLTSGAMTASLNRLEKKGLVERTREQEDARIRGVVLTRKGVALVDDAIAVRFAEADSALEGLAPRDRQRLTDLLRKLSLSLTD